MAGQIRRVRRVIAAVSPMVMQGIAGRKAKRGGLLSRTKAFGRSRVGASVIGGVRRVLRKRRRIQRI